MSFENKALYYISLFARVEKQPHISKMETRVMYLRAAGRISVFPHDALENNLPESTPNLQVWNSNVTVSWMLDDEVKTSVDNSPTF